LKGWALKLGVIRHGAKLAQRELPHQLGATIGGHIG